MQRITIACLMGILAACGASNSGSPDGGGGGSFHLTCESGSATFPGLDKACAVDADCALVDHTTSCCGSMTAIGLAKDSVAAFQQAEAACSAGYPGCGCAAGPTKAEDGRDATQGTIMVHCASGSCTSYVP